ncbi:SLC26A/SulP transporter family protein [Propionivibrio dicarboxylicus]|uniref:STAS domain-containing protein n=1 Tax=Propionivibrio dicarboxylicus TaxID=83767 RepID=A0A1G8IC88_9RHOO|nr:SulP family inorganic anion transporter [Propionivibrio dicarboxylicus]SDI16504.1 STAS domain-containing protein [Propionivibrio dicarboxylicus]
MTAGKNWNWKGDLMGGASAALAAVPVELVYGLFAVAPLGSVYANHGLRAAVWGCVLGGLLGAVFRCTGGMLTGSRPATGLILGALASSLLHHPDIQSARDPLALIFILLLSCTAFAGAMQWLFGVARVGRALKFVPYPVLAGLLCGVACLMTLSALRPIVGVGNGTPWSNVFGVWHPLSAIVAFVTLAVCVKGPKLTKRIPGVVLALFVGTAVHHALVALFGVGMLGSTSGHIDGLVPELSVLQGLREFGPAMLIDWVPTLAPFALSIAAFASLETMLCLSSIESATHVRANGDRELRVQGLANLLAGSFGATPAVGNLSRVVMNVSTGGRTPVSGLAYAAVMALVALVAGHWVGLVPSAVTAGILLFYANAMVDDGVRRLVRQVMRQRSQFAPEQYRTLLVNVTVVFLVALVAVFGGMMKAVGVGVVAAVVIFVHSSMKPPIRRVYACKNCRSLKVRTPAHMEILEAEGGRIAVIEVDGTLFFGTADRLAVEAERVASEASLIIIDMQRVRDVDPTGARTLLQIARKLRGKKVRVAIAGAPRLIESFLTAMGLSVEIPVTDWHADLDVALECAEDELLAKHGVDDCHATVRLSETALTAGLTPMQVDILSGYMNRRVLASEGRVFGQGDAGESVFVATDSVVDILIPLNDGRQKRVASFAPGIVFGEMALLEGKPRSADAVVKGPSAVLELARYRLDEIMQAHPEIACQVLHNLSVILAGRLRLTTQALRLQAEG